MDLQILYEIRDINAKLDSLSFSVDEPDVVDGLENIKDSLEKLDKKFDTLIDINQQILEALQDKK